MAGIDISLRTGEREEFQVPIFHGAISTSREREKIIVLDIWYFSGWDLNAWHVFWQTLTISSIRFVLAFSSTSSFLASREVTQAYIWREKNKSRTKQPNLLRELELPLLRSNDAIKNHFAIFFIVYIECWIVVWRRELRTRPYTSSEESQWVHCVLCCRSDRHHHRWKIVVDFIPVSVSLSSLSLSPRSMLFSFVFPPCNRSWAVLNFSPAHTVFRLLCNVPIYIMAKKKAPSNRIHERGEQGQEKRTCVEYDEKKS